MSNDIKKILIEIWDADAIVLFDWLASIELENVKSVPVTKAQKQALTDLFFRLEESVIIESQQQIDTASYEVSKDMNWS